MSAAPPWGNAPDLASAAAAIAARRVSPVRLVEQCLDRIGAGDPAIHAFLRVRRDEALAEARAAEHEIAQGRYRGPLHGIPVGLKDNIDVAGLPTTANSRVRQDAVATRSAPAWQALADAGAILLGKLTMHEFALGGSVHDLPWPPARNPWDPRRGINGSSSGSAAAVAAGFVLAALGTDTGGSVRVPAFCCGVIGLKPTYGQISCHGIFPLAPTLDTVGPIARTVADCEIVYRSLRGEMAGGSPPKDLARVKVGLPVRWLEDELPPSPAVRAALDHALDRLRHRGVDVIPVALPPLEDFIACMSVIMLAEAWAVHESTIAARYADYGRIARCRLLPGALLSASDYIAAQALRRQVAAKVGSAFRDVDAVLSVPAAAQPPPIDEPYRPESFLQKSYARPFSLTGHPTIAVPLGASPEGLPSGVQLTCRLHDEATLFRIARALEA